MKDACIETMQRVVDEFQKVEPYLFALIDLLLIRAESSSGHR